MIVTLALLQISNAYLAILEWQEGPGLISHRKGKIKNGVKCCATVSFNIFLLLFANFVGVLLRVRKQQGKSAKPP
jgi:hypothetical protein